MAGNVRVGWRSRGQGLTLGIAVLAAAAGAGAGAGTALRWKFRAGESLHYQMVIDRTTILKANGQEMKVAVRQTLDTTWAVESVAADGSAEIAQTFDRIRSRVDSPLAKMEFDSDSSRNMDGPLAAGVVPVLRLLVGAKFRYKISPQGELADVRLPEGLAKALKAAGPTAPGVGMFSEEGLKNMIVQTSFALPPDGLTKGQTWTRTTRSEEPPVGTRVSAKTYTYEGPADGVEKICLNTKMTLEPLPGGLETKVNGQESKGTFLFDNRAGRVLSAKTHERVELVFAVMNNPVTQVAETDSSMTLSEAKPSPPAAPAPAPSGEAAKAAAGSKPK